MADRDEPEPRRRRRFGRIPAPAKPAALAPVEPAQLPERQAKEPAAKAPAAAKPPRAQRWAAHAEDLHGFTTWALRLLELMIVGLFMLGATWSAVHWFFVKNPPLNQVVKVLGVHWQGSLIVMLIALIPTLHDLVDRLITLPGGTTVRPRERRIRPDPEDKT